MTDEATTSHVPSAWEVVAVSKMRPKVVRMARGIQGLRHLGWTDEDVQNEMLIAVVKACRTWANDRSEEPDPRYLMRAVVCCRYRVWERVQKAWDQDTSKRTPVETEYGEPKNLESVYREPPAQPDSLVDNSIVAQNRDAVLYSLRQSMDPNDFALLQLRSMDFSPKEIAELMGLKKDGVADFQEVSRQLWRVRQKAAEFLRQVGIHTYEDVVEANQRTLFGEENPT